MITPSEAHNIFEERVKEKHDSICSTLEKNIDDKLLVYLKVYEETKEITFFEEDLEDWRISGEYDCWKEVLQKYSNNYLVKLYVTETHYTYSDKIYLEVTKYSLSWSPEDTPEYVEVRKKVTQESPWVRCPIKEKPKKWWEFWK